jgi:hypothetical protein
MGHELQHVRVHLDLLVSGGPSQDRDGFVLVVLVVVLVVV